MTMATRLHGAFEPPLAIRELASGLQFPEGPVAMDDGSILVVEIARGTLTRIGADGRQGVVAHLGGGPNGAAIGPDGSVYVCNNGGFRWHRDEHGLRQVGAPADFAGGSIQRVNLATGGFDIVYDQVDGRRLLGPNDIVFDRDGGFWFTDFGKTHAHERKRDIGSVYYAQADGSAIHEVIHPILSPNGVGLSPDESVLYVADTESARLWAFDIVSPGVIKEHPFPAQAGGRLLGVGGDNALQRFDSLAVDAEGNVCIATILRGGITVVSADGSAVAHVPLGEAFFDRFTTNICFGGAGLRQAFITLSAGGRLAVADWPKAGLPLNFQR